MANSQRLFSLILFLCLIIIVNSYKIAESENDAAIIARTLVKEFGIGTLVTIMNDEKENVRGYPFGLFDYLADDCPSTGNPLLLLSDLQKNVQNSRKDSWKASLMIRKLSKNDTFFPFAEPRLNLFGHLERVSEEDVAYVQECFLDKHPRARWWVPGKSKGHAFHFYRFIVQEIYFVGGFGGTHYIGYIDNDLYHEVEPDKNTFISHHCNEEVEKEQSRRIIMQYP